MNASRPEPEAAEPSRPAMKFLYGTGDRPLEGYTIRRGIGRGGFGEVYFAESDAGKEVAMKLIRRNLEVELRGVRHCLNLKHANLVALYDIRTDESGDEWVIMEYVSSAGAGGNSLEEVIEQHPGGMPTDEVVRWMHGIAAGVGHLHDNGIVHRDLKPGNIFIDGETVKIGDYGLSKFISASRRSGQTESIGTVHYMAPEIANGRYGREIDTYALGIILYEMLTGCVPFEGESVGEVLMKHLTAEPDLSRLDEPYREVVRRALTKDPESRLQGVGELIELLPGEPTIAAGPRAARPSEHAAARVDPAPIGGAGSAATEGVTHSIADDTREPIYAAVIDAWDGLWRWWRETSLHPLARAGIVLGSIALILMLGIPLFGPLVGAMVVYCVYYVFVWSLFILPGVQERAKQRSAANAETAKFAAARQRAATPREKRHTIAAQARRIRLGWREAARKEIAEKPFRAKITELVGSMLIAALLCGAMSFAVAGVLSEMVGASDSSVVVQMALWFAIASTLGAWTVLTTNKLTEGKVEDQIPMRGLLLGLGALTGLVVGVIALDLPTGLPDSREMGPGVRDSLAHDLLAFPRDYAALDRGAGVAPTIGMSIAYFAFLFVVLRWWRLAELTRDRRLSLWSVAMCAGWAWLLHLCWWYPQPTGMAIAVITATAVQLASPWMPPSKREELARGKVA